MNCLRFKGTNQKQEVKGNLTEEDSKNFEDSVDEFTVSEEVKDNLIEEDSKKNSVEEFTVSKSNQGLMKQIIKSIQECHLLPLEMNEELKPTDLPYKFGFTNSEDEITFQFFSEMKKPLENIFAQKEIEVDWVKSDNVD